MVGDVPVGGGAPISVQTMTKTKTGDVKGTLEQIRRCEEAGVDIVRVTVNDWDAAEGIKEIVKGTKMPIVADIHINHVFAIKALEAGVAKVRLNPGNIGSLERIHKVLGMAKERNTPIRIGVNSGSLEKDILEKHGYPTAEALFESAMRHVEICEDFGFSDVIISVKSTDVRLMIAAYRITTQGWDPAQATDELINGGFGYHASLFPGIAEWLRSGALVPAVPATTLIKPKTTTVEAKP